MQRFSGDSVRPTSANSTLSFAESLRNLTPSPTDDEADQIWEAARNAAPIFPDLDFAASSSSHGDESDLIEHPAIYRLGPGERAIVQDSRDATGNRQSVLLVYEADDESVQSTLVVQTHSDYPNRRPSRVPQVSATQVQDQHRATMRATTTDPTRATSATDRPANGKGKGKAMTVYKLKKVFKLAASFRANGSGKSPVIPEKTSAPLRQRPDLPQIRPVELPTGSAQPKLAQPAPKKTVGHPDRMTNWGDFSQYKAAEDTPRRKKTPDLNKPLPRVPSPNSHLRLTRVPETMFGSPDSPPPVPAIPSRYRKSAHRRTAVYAGSIFSSDEEVIDTYGSSDFGTPAAAQTPPTSDDEADGDSIERLQLVNRLQKLSTSNGNRLNTGLDSVFGPDDDDYKSPVVDTFVHDRHTSFIITERLDENTIRSMYGTEERRDGDSPRDDPAKALWNRLTMQVGGGGWSGE